MSTTTKEAKPLVTHVRYHAGEALFIFGSLFLLGCLGSWIFEAKEIPDSPWIGVVLMGPATAFLIGMIVLGIYETKRGSRIVKSNSKNVSAYLRDNYRILVHESDCAVYCDNPVSTSMNKVIPAEDLNTGNSIRITLKFSDDFTSVTPFVVNSTPLKPLALA